MEVLVMELLVIIAIAIIAVAIVAVAVDFTVGLGTVVDAIRSAVRSLRPHTVRIAVNKEIARRQHQLDKDSLRHLHDVIESEIYLIPLPQGIQIQFLNELNEIRFKHRLGNISIKKAVKQTDRIEYELNRALKLLK